MVQWNVPTNITTTNDRGSQYIPSPRTYLHIMRLQDNRRYFKDKHDSPSILLPMPKNETILTNYSWYDTEIIMHKRFKI